MPGCSECARLVTQASNILGGLADFSFGPDADVVFIEYKADGSTEEHVVASIEKMVRLLSEGDATSTFKVANAVNDDEAVPLGQLMQLLDEQVEYGENANGSYFKYANGFLICLFNGEDDNISIDNEYGAWYWGRKIWHYPLSFAVPPSVPAPFFKRDSALNIGIVAQRPSTDYVEFRTIDLFSRPADGTVTQLSFMAIGRWK